MMENLLNLISKKYRKQNEILHKKGFGASGHRWADIVIKIIKDYNIKSMLDYGCGQSTLYTAIRDKWNSAFTEIEYKEYDPCIPSKKICPGNADLITCTDVLEHIEPKFLDNVLVLFLRFCSFLIYLYLKKQDIHSN